MQSPLDKARKDPGSMKARILTAARKLFGEFGYASTTTRMIAKEVGIDISTLYYHWGEKNDLYEAVITDLNDEIQSQLKGIEKLAKGKTMKARIEIAIENICDYLFEHPEAANLILYRYFTKNSQGQDIDIRIPEYINNIAVAMGLALDRRHISPQAKARVLAVWNSVFNFISGENFFRPMLEVDHEEYIQVVKDTLKFVLVPAFDKLNGRKEKGFEDSRGQGAEG